MNFAQLAITPKRLSFKHEKLWRLFRELHSHWKEITVSGRDRNFGELEIADLDAKSQSFLVVFLGVHIEVRYVFSPWLDAEADRGTAILRYSLIDPCRPTDKPLPAGQFTYRTDGIVSVSGYESEQLDFDEPNTGFELLALMLRDSVQIAR